MKEEIFNTDISVNGHTQKFHVFFEEIKKRIYEQDNVDEQIEMIVEIKKIIMELYGGEIQTIPKKFGGMDIPNVFMQLSKKNIGNKTGEYTMNMLDILLSIKNGWVLHKYQIAEMEREQTLQNYTFTPDFAEEREKFLDIVVENLINVLSGKRRIIYHYIYPCDKKGMCGLSNFQQSVKGKILNTLRINILTSGQVDMLNRSIQLYPVQCKDQSVFVLTEGLHCIKGGKLLGLFLNRDQYIKLDDSQAITLHQKCGYWCSETKNPPNFV